MRLITISLICTINLTGCISYNKFQDFQGESTASIKVSRPSEDQYQTAIKIVNEHQLLELGIADMSCYTESQKYWQHAESLGHWWDKPDIFDITLKVRANVKQYLLVKNWVIGANCGKVVEFKPIANKQYDFFIEGLAPTCSVVFKPREQTEGYSFEVTDIPGC